MSRRCLICANINPCRQHSDADQRAELARNDAEIAKIRARQAMPKADEPPVAVEPSPNLTAQIARLLAADPVCGGRVASGTIEAIARLAGPDRFAEGVEAAAKLIETRTDLRPTPSNLAAAIRNLSKEGEG